MIVVRDNVALRCQIISNHLGHHKSQELHQGSVPHVSLVGCEELCQKKVRQAHLVASTLESAAAGRTSRSKSIHDGLRPIAA